MPECKVEQRDVDEVLNECGDNIDSGISLFPNATYEEGVWAAIKWLLEGGENPMKE